MQSLRNTMPARESFLIREVYALNILNRPLCTTTGTSSDQIMARVIGLVKGFDRIDVTKPDHGPVVSKFGDWDESDPSAGEGFTHIFNKVQEEKQSETGKVPILPTETSYSSNAQKQSANDSSKGCFCFPWGRK